MRNELKSRAIFSKLKILDGTGDFNESALKALILTIMSFHWSHEIKNIKNELHFHVYFLG